MFSSSKLSILIKVILELYIYSSNKINLSSPWFMHIVIYLLLLLVWFFLFIKWVCGLNFTPLFTENLSSPDQTVPYIPDTILYFQCPEYIHDPSHSPQSMHLSSMFPRVTPHFLCPRLSIICPRSFSVGCSNILPNNYRVHLDLLQLPQKTKKQNNNK